MNSADLTKPAPFPVASVTKFRLPSFVLVFGAILGFQLGTVISKPAIENMGAIHSSFVRIAIGAVFLLIWARPSRELVRTHWCLILITGLLMAGMNLTMFAAIERIPIGIAIAIEFWGPMVLALAGTHRARDMIWVALAAAGILLFTPLADASFDTLGVFFAVVSGAGFAAVLVCSSRLGMAVGGIRAPALAMAVAALVLAPISLGSGLEQSLSWSLLGQLTLAAVVTNCLAMPMEFTALTRIRPAIYAVLICLEPAAGAILAFLLLGERIGATGILGIIVVSVAAVGATRSSNMAHT